jgi:hypothetical protein
MDIHGLMTNSVFITLFPCQQKDPENWKVYRVWWGQKESMVVAGDTGAVAGADSYDSVHPKKLFIQGLPKISSELEAIARRAELERAFHKYGGNEGMKYCIRNNKPRKYSPNLLTPCHWLLSRLLVSGAIVTAPLNCTFAFVELESERQVELALSDKKLVYRMSKARRNRFEALQEQRAAAKIKERTEEEWE